MMDGREAWMGKKTESEGAGIWQEWVLKNDGVKSMGMEREGNLSHWQ